MKKNVVRVLALVLVALMCLSLIPFAAHAEEHVHQFEPITVPATCQYNGYVQMICPICGAGGEIVSYLNELAPHSFVCVEDEQYVIEAGDCEHATLYWKSCSVCGVSAEEEYGEQVRKMQEELVGRMATREITLAEAESIAADRVRVFDEHYKFSAGGTGHHYIQVEHQEATCTSDGWKDYSYCDNCGEYFGYEAIPAKGHRWNEFTVTKAATCTEDGSRERACDVCGEKEVEVLPALGHQGEFTVTKAATCTQDGSMERTCTVCGEKEVVVIPAAHTWGAFTVTEEPGCYASGAQEHTCTVCGTTELEYIPAAHKYENGVCSVCGEAAPEGYVAAATESFQGEEEKTEEPAPAEETKSETEEPAEEAKTEGENLSGDDTIIFAAGEGPWRVYFDTNGGNNVSAPQFISGSKGEHQPLPDIGSMVRQNHTLMGWNNDRDGNGVFYPLGAEYYFFDDETLYAQWDVRITYLPNADDAEGGPMASTPVVPGGNATLSENVYKRSGYAFKNWNTEPDGTGTSYEDGKQITAPSSDMKLYAQWAKSPLTLSFDNNDGTGEIAPEKITWGDPCTLPVVDPETFKFDDYTFLGWNTTHDGTGDSYADGATIPAKTFTKDTVLYAQWSKTVYTVTFNGNTATGGAMEDQSIDTSSDSSLTLDKNGFEKTGYAFIGWNTKADGSGTNYADEEVIPATSFTHNLILYAQWKQADFTVKFDANRGSGTGEGEMASQSIDTSTETKLVLNENTFTNVGYEFVNWNTKGNGSGTSYEDHAEIPVSEITEDLTLYAQWKQVVFKVTFNPNGGSLPAGKDMDPQSIDTRTQKSLTLKANAYTKDKSVFIGWNTKKDGSGTSLSDKATIPSTSFKGNVTLYAQWATVIVFDGNNATSGSMEPQEFTLTDPPETILLKANAFIRTNWAFNKWTENADGTGKSWPDQGDYVADASRTLYAQWIKTAFSVNYDKNGGGGTAMSPTTVNKGDSGTVLVSTYNAPDSTKMFGEWNTKPDGSGTGYQPGASIKSDNVPSDITLYAIWRDKLDIWFYPGEGSGTARSIEEPKDTVVKLPSAASEPLKFDPQSGMAFAGWRLGDGDKIYKSGQQVVFGDEDKVVNDVVYTTARTVTAIWAKEITITYDPNGASTTGRKLQRAAKDADTRLAPISQIGYTRTGYAFTGWGRLSGSDPEKPDYTDNQLVAGGFPNDTTLYALWLKHAFTGKVNVTGTLSFGSETAYVGEILTANVTGEDYFNNFSYQWYRDGYDEGYQIPGETGITYEPVAEDFGHVLFCVVTAKEADEGENTAISNLKVVGIDESDKRIVNNGQTESDYIYGLLPDMFYSINNGPKYLVELDDLGLFEVKQQGVYRFYTADDLQVGSVNVVNWWTIGFGVSTGSGDNAGSGTATMRRGSTTLTASTTITSDGVAILQPYSGVEGYSSVWIVRQDANITDLSLNVRPASSSYGHVSLNSGSYTSSSAERTFYLGTLSGPMMYTVVFNKSSSSPKTADMSNLGLWSTLCFVSLAGTVTILGSARKRRKEGK